MRTHRLERFGRQPPPAQVLQGAAEGAAGRLGLRLSGLVVDGAVLHGRAGWRLAVKRKQKGGGGRGGEGKGRRRARLAPAGQRRFLQRAPSLPSAASGSSGPGRCEGQGSPQAWGCSQVL